MELIHTQIIHSTKEMEGKSVLENIWNLVPFLSWKESSLAKWLASGIYN